MPNYTPNLNLFKYDVYEDRKEPYSIINCLNNNWDKLDVAYSTILTDINNRISQIKTQTESDIEKINDKTDDAIEDMQTSIKKINYTPNFSKGEKCFNGYITPANGWLICGVRLDSYASHVYVNNVSVHSTYPKWLGDWSGWVIESTVPVEFGKTIKLDGNAYATFYPNN